MIFCFQSVSIINYEQHEIQEFLFFFFFKSPKAGLMMKFYHIVTSFDKVRHVWNWRLGNVLFFCFFFKFACENKKPDNLSPYLGDQLPFIRFECHHRLIDIKYVMVDVHRSDHCIPFVSIRFVCWSAYWKCAWIVVNMLIMCNFVRLLVEKSCFGATFFFASKLFWHRNKFMSMFIEVGVAIF